MGRKQAWAETRTWLSLSLAYSDWFLPGQDLGSLRNLVGFSRNSLREIGVRFLPFSLPIMRKNLSGAMSPVLSSKLGKRMTGMQTRLLLCWICRVMSLMLGP